jgi:cytochrome c oxidase cbb3-type subunit III
MLSFAVLSSFPSHGQWQICPAPEAKRVPYHLVRLSAKKSIIVAKVLLIMRKNSFWIFAFSALLLAGTDPTWAQNQAEGKKLYLTYCSSCHGDNGKGDGPAAQSLPVKPANHTSGAVMNQLTDQFLMEIISKGGSAVGKSPMMPAWGGQFKENQLRDIVAYVRSIADPPYKPAGK